VCKPIQVILILGRKPDGCGIHPELINRCERAIILLKNTPEYENIVIISGGKTVEGLPSEAEAGERYLRDRISSVKGKVTFIKEEEARTTSENIVLTQKLLCEKNIVPEKLVIIGRKSQIPKVRVLLWRLWKTKPQNVICMSCLDTAPFWYQCFDVICGSIISMIDPYDLFFLRRFKKIHRNGKTNGGA